MMGSRPQLGQRLDALYGAVRDSATVDRQVAFDIAMSELELMQAQMREDDHPALRKSAMAALGETSSMPGG